VTRTTARSPPSTLADVPELVEVLRSYAAPLLPAARPRFFEAVDRAIAGSELGAGILSRVCAEQQRKFLAADDPRPVVDGRR
jgi:hypothetical protein